MRAIRLVSSMVATLGLVASTTGAVMGQDDAPPPVAHVTGTVVEGIVHPEVLYEEYDEEELLGGEGGYDVYLGGPELIEHTVEWSDPRLPSTHWMILDYHSIFEAAEGLDGAMTTVITHLLEDESGSWTGQGRLVVDADEQYSFHILTGQGAYEGLYALLRGVPDAERPGPYDPGFEGYIFEGELPQFPRAPAPVTTPGVKTFPLPTEPPTE